MSSSKFESQTFTINGIRNILSDDISENKINRIVMAIRTRDSNRTSIDLKEIRPLLLDDFSLDDINKVMMTLKLSNENQTDYTKCESNQTC